MEYEEMRAMEQTHVCAECGAPLVTAWTKDGKGYALVCGRNRSHQGYKPILSPSQALAQGKMDEVAGKGTQEALEQLAKEGKAAVSLMLTTDLASRHALSEEQVKALVTWGITIGVKPWLGHVCLYFGKPYLTIDGYYYKNNKRQTPYSLSTRPMSASERKDYQLAKGDYGWLAEARDRDGASQGIGIGIVTRDEVEGKSDKNPEQFRAPVVHSHPQRMAEKRAEWQLLRKLIPLEKPE